MSKYLDTLLKMKNGSYGSEHLAELEKIEQFVKGNITSQELMQNADYTMQFIVYHTLNKIINYEEKDVRYYMELPSSIFLGAGMPYCIWASKVDEIDIDHNVMKNIGPKTISKYYPIFNIREYYSGDYRDYGYYRCNKCIEVTGDFSQFPNGVMLFGRDWYRIISKYPNLVERVYYLTINNYELEEKFRHISIEEVQQRVDRIIIYESNVPEDGEPKFLWLGKEEAKYLPPEVIDSIKFVIPREYVTKQQVADGQFGTFEEILNSSNSLESSQAEFFSEETVKRTFR